MVTSQRTGLGDQFVKSTSTVYAFTRQSGGSLVTRDFPGGLVVRRGFRNNYAITAGSAPQSRSSIRSLTTGRLGGPVLAVAYGAFVRPFPPHGIIGLNVTISRAAR